MKPIFILIALFNLSACVTSSEYCRQWFEVGTDAHYQCVMRTNQQRAQAFQQAAQMPLFQPQQQMQLRPNTVTYCEPVGYNGAVECRSH